MKTEPQPVKELRDEFAMAALNGLLKEDWIVNVLAESSYEVADAMLEARSNNKNKG